jgi:drug/metabolite transporter (DMT)-like permease
MDESSLTLGCGITIAGASLINIGTILVKLSMDRDRDSTKERSISGASSSNLTQVIPKGSMTKTLTPVQRKRSSNFLNIPDFHHNFFDRFVDRISPTIIRRAGLFLFVSGNLLTFSALSMVPQTLVSSLSSVQFVSNVIFSYILLHEPICDRALAGTTCIILGNVLVVLSDGKSPHQEVDVHLLFELLQDTIFIYYLITIFSLSSVSFITYAIVSKQVKDSKESGDEEAAMKADKRHETLGMLAYALYAGPIGTLAIICAKCVSMLLSSSAEMSVYVIVILVAWICIMVFWLRQVGRSLMIFKNPFIVPLMQVVWIVFGAIGGGTFFQEFTIFERSQFFYFGAGIACIILGTFNLAPGSKAKIEIEEPTIDESVEGKMTNQLMLLDINSGFNTDAFLTPNSTPRSPGRKGTTVKVSTSTIPEAGTVMKQEFQIVTIK